MYRYAFSAMLALILAFNVEAGVDDDNLRKALTQQLEKFSSSWATGSIESGMSIYHADAVYMSDKGLINVQALTQRYRKMLVGDYANSRLGLTEIEVKRLSDDIALMTGRFELVMPSGVGGTSGWVTLVWIRSDDNWTIIHDHSS